MDCPVNAHHQPGLRVRPGRRGGVCVCDSTLPYSCVYELSRFLYGAGRGGGAETGKDAHRHVFEPHAGSERPP